MADSKLYVIPFPTFSKFTLGLNDLSVYEGAVASTLMQLTPPGFDPVDLPFMMGEINVFDSTDLNITETGENICPLPDGIYRFVYSIVPVYTDAFAASFMRVEQIQEKFDKAFMTLDMMECDMAIKTQSKVELSTIYFLIQGSIAAANNCAEIQATKLYQQADRKLDYFLAHNCGCTGTNYVVNYP